MLPPLPSPELVFYAPSYAEQQVICSPIHPVIHLEAEVQGNEKICPRKPKAVLPKKP